MHASTVARRLTIGLLRSPLGRRLGRTVTVIGYRGRRSGRRLATPVEYVREGDRVTILVARPAGKQWWRNVRADGSVTLLLDGTERIGAATVMEPSAGGHAPGGPAGAAVASYVARRPRAAAAADTAVMVVVELTDVDR